MGAAAELMALELAGGGGWCEWKIQGGREGSG
jgi:hypothetical protein